MRRPSGPAQPQILMPTMGPVVRAILIVTVVAFLTQLLCERFFEFPLTYVLGFVPQLQLQGWIWQPFTYAFLHAGILHMVFNLLVLWSIGSELEQAWGWRFFLGYFFACTVGAAATYAFVAAMGWGGNVASPVVGSSGAVYGLLLAYGMLFGERVLYFFMIFPMRAKYFVMIIGGIVLISTISQGGDGVAHAAHLGGLISGLVVLFSYTFWRKSQRQWAEAKTTRKQQAKAERARNAQHLRLVRGGDDDDNSADPKIWH